jgi:hypothetical protein
VIADTLAEFGDNIDAAIRHLNELQLSAAGTSKQHALQEQQRQGILGPPPPMASLDAAAAAAKEDAKAAGGAAEPATGAAPLPTRTAEEWIDHLVQEMAAAADLVDAKRRASDVLRAFEQAVLTHSEAQAGDAARENALLKRAVAIQNARLQELSGREAEAAELRAELDAARARLHSLEVQNYSLQVHLKAAADAQGAALTPGRTNPDVF